jgi:hypothetical protein
MRKLSRIADYRLGNQNGDIPDTKLEDPASHSHVRFQLVGWLVGSSILLRLCKYQYTELV